MVYPLYQAIQYALLEFYTTRANYFHRVNGGFDTVDSGWLKLLLACDLNYIQDETYRELNQQVNEVRMMLNSFILCGYTSVNLFHVPAIVRHFVGADLRVCPNDGLTLTGGSNLE